MGLKDRLRNLEREADAETVVLLCPACSVEISVHWNTSFEWLAHRWAAETDAETFRGPPPDVLVVEAHELETSHPAEDLAYETTGENWLAEFTPNRRPNPRPSNAV